METPSKLSQTENLYALNRLDTARRGLLQLSEEMPACRAKVDRFMEADKAGAKDWYHILNALKETLLDHLEVCRLSLTELEQDGLALYTARFSQAAAAFAVMTPDYGKFTALLKDYLQRLPSRETITTNARVIGRLMNNVRMGYYPTDPDHVKRIARGIAFPPGVTTNLLDPCCGCGTALRLLATGNNCITYGVELDESRAEEAQSRLHRIAVGSFFFSRVSHEAFHLLFLNPPYLSVVGEGGTTARHEKRFLVESLEKLMPGGLLVYIIPYYRVTRDIARILCDNFTDISVYKFTGKEFDRFRQVVIFGIRKQRGNGLPQVPVLMAACADSGKIPPLDQLLEGRYPLPPRSLAVPVFKGTVFNQRELARQLAASHSIAKHLMRSPLDSRERHPLLPLNVGQVGLIGGSGFINGLIDCRSPHIVKGRVTKETVVSVNAVREDEHGNPVSREQSETVTNKLTFNILTAAGFRSLTQATSKKGG